ncbi:gallate 1-beta-glucosyltransferase 84A24 [Cicer arietinum]|uniref:Glycosyltransferase n=1 Tax=Cicer arietinum TaxID=3827 RepID=A0A067XU26_CICAR|nr:gallate 1-beta-glucosyltransferase [Cicer arietinum]AGU14110.1 UDP-glycosyltransferase [Cicer arietinum]
MGSKAPIHILLVSYPAQGHINPLLRLAKCLAAKGSSVIFTTTKKAGKDMQTGCNITDKTVTPIGDGSLTFNFFDDGFKEDDPIRTNLSDYTPQLEHVGKKHVSKIIKNYADLKTPISCIINNIFIPWVCDVATEHKIPFAILWSESSAVFTAYYNYFHKLARFPSKPEPYIDVQLCSLLLKHNEIPDLLHPFNNYPFLGTLILEQIKNLSKALCVLVDTYEELEHDFIDYISNKSVVIRPIGPLFNNPKIKCASNIRGDFVKSDDCNIIEWLNSKPLSSVVYISFGTIVSLPQEQVNEIAYGLLNSKQVSFLWVLKVKTPPNEIVLPDGFLEETNGRGKVVKWGPQVEVLAHPSLACFITHCGWNSSMEAIALGVPVLTFPAWGDQVTNAKFLVDVFGVGIRLGYSRAENKLVSRDEVKKCLLEVMAGEKAEELKKNAIKWKKAAEAAVAVGGSSDWHLNAFIEDIKKRDP